MSKAEDRITTLPEVNSDRWLSLEDLIGESWRPIVGYEDKYLVSNFGRVKSLERILTKSDVPNAKWSRQKHPTKILKSYKNMYGYYMVYLSNRGSTKSFLVHRLVGMAFIPNINNLPQINHKDECKTHNSVWINLDGSIDFEKSNLEWCDNKYNSNYGTKRQRIAEKLSRPVQKYGTDGFLICEYPSAMEASRQTGLSVSRIVDCCNGRKKSVTGGGYFWKYKDSDKVILAKPKIIQISTNGQIINVWDKISLAAKTLKICPTSICNCISGLSKTAGGYIWKKE